MKKKHTRSYGLKHVNLDLDEDFQFFTKNSLNSINIKILVIFSVFNKF